MAAVGKGAVVPQLPPAHAFEEAAQQVYAISSRAVPCLTLVTLECTPVDIVMSVIGEGGEVYSPRVLHPGC